MNVTMDLTMSPQKFLHADQELRCGSVMHGWGERTDDSSIIQTAG